MADNAYPYPLAAPTVSGTTITVEMMLEQPTRITRYISDITLQRFWFDRVFSAGGGVSGGSIIYDQLVANDLYPTRDVQNVEPGAEFPVITSDDPTPLVAKVEKFGGKAFITDEAVRRNDSGKLQRNLNKIGNAIVRKLHTKAIAVLDAEIAARSSALSVVGNNWNTVVTGGSSQSNASLWPLADLGKVQTLAEKDELGVVYDTLLINPDQALALTNAYGPQWRALLREAGWDVVSTPRVAAGTAYVAEGGGVGEFRLEKGLSTETWREHKIQATWVQSDVAPVFVVTNPYSVRKLTGLAG